MRNEKGQFVKGNIPWTTGKKRPPVPESVRLRISNALKGRKLPPRSQEHIKNLSISLTGRIGAFTNKTHSVESKKKISAAHIGKSFTLDHKLKLSLIKKGKKTGPFSEERRRISSLYARKGERSNFWKGGVSSVNQKIRVSMEYRLWREAVYKRDDYRCMDCGERGGQLNADHILPFAYFERLRFDINNGQTLCRPCHKKTLTYGSKAKNYQLTN